MRNILIGPALVRISIKLGITLELYVFLDYYFASNIEIHDT